MRQALMLLALVISAAAAGEKPVLILLDFSCEGDDAFGKKLEQVLALEKQARFNDAMNLCREMKTEFKGDPRQRGLNTVYLRLRQERMDSLELQYAVKNLSSDNPSTVNVAKRKLLRSGETGLIFLRLRLKSRESVTATAAAAEALGEARDAESIPLLIKWLEDEKRSDLTVAIMKALRRMAGEMDQDHLRACHRLLTEDEELQRRELVGVFDELLREVCKGDAAKFNEVVGDPEAYSDLADFFERSIVSGDEELVTFACAYGAEFLGYLNGVRADYFSDTAFHDLALSVFENDVHQASDRAFPFPGGRQDNVSIRWSGFFRADRDGEYIFWGRADDVISVYVGGKLVMSNREHWQDRHGRITLKSGLHPFRVDFTQSTGGSWIRLEGQGPGFARTAALPLRVRPWKKPVMDMAGVIGDLTADDEVKIRAARHKVMNRGEVGRMFLRNSLRHGKLEEATAAGALLTQWRDGRAARFVLERIGQEHADSPLLPLLSRTLRDLGAHADRDVTVETYRKFLDDSREMSPFAAGLCGILDLKFHGSRTDFNAFVGAEDAHEGLKNHVTSALISSNVAAVVRACEYGHPFVSLVRGVRGDYYEGEELDKKVLTRLEGAIQVAENGFPMPNNRQDKIGALWTGYLRVDKPGQYNFALRAENEGNVWVSGRHVVAASYRHQERGGSITLQPGTHPFKAQFREWNGTATMRLNWDGPGIGRQALTSTWLRAHPWRSIVAALPKAVRMLGSEEKGEWAGSHIRHMEPLGRYFLRKAVREEGQDSAGPAARMLVRMGDSGAVAVVVARMKKDPASALLPSSLTVMSGLSDRIADADLLWLFEQMKQDGELRMGAPAAALCAVLGGACRGDRKRFDAKLGSDTAAAELAAYMSGVRRTKDPEALFRFCEHGGPFAPRVKGIRGEYFEGDNFDRPFMVRRDTQCLVGHGRFPHPKNRQDNVSVRWTGWMRTDQPGDYAFTAYTRKHMDVWIDGARILAARGNDAGATRKLDRGHHALRVEYRQSAGGSRSGSLHWSGPGISTRQVLTSSWLTIPLWSFEAAKLPELVRKLGSAKEEDVKAARAAIAAVDPAGREFLRKALRDENDAVAAAAIGMMSAYRDYGSEAAPFLRYATLHRPGAVAETAVDMLVAGKDQGAAQVFLEKLKGEKPGSPLVPVLTRGLRGLAAHVDADTCEELFRAMKSDERPMSPYAAALCGALDLACGGAKAKFSELVGDAAAYEALRDRVVAALKSEDESVVLQACEYGAPFAPVFFGLQGRYYAGKDFDKHVLTRLDPTIDISENKFPMPDGRQDNLSARWTGYLWIDKAGDYKFYMRAENEGRMWLDSKQVLHSTSRHGDAGATVNLARGRHPVKVEFREWRGESTIRLWWEGPGIAKQYIPRRAFRVHPWRAELEGLAGTASAIASTDEKVLASAKSRIRNTDPVSRVLLRRSLRFGPEPLASEAVRLLIMSEDSATPAALIDRVKASPNATLAPSVMAGLAGLAHRLSPEHIAWAGSQVAADDQARMGAPAAALCALLERRCGRDPAAFDKLVGTAGSRDILAAYVNRALRSTDPAVLIRACEYGAPLACRANGLKGEYYEGYSFDKLYRTRLDTKVAWERDKLRGSDGNRQNNLSVRWTGWLRIDKEGDYGFRLSTRANADMWIAGRHVVSARGRDAEGKTKLAKGYHPIRVDYRQSAHGERWIFLDWHGPGFGHTRLTSSFLRTRLWRGELSRLVTAAKELGSDDADKLAKARGLFLARDAASRDVLRNVVFNGPERAASQAADLLLYRDDSKIVAEMLRLLEEDPKWAVSWPVLNGLTENVHRIPEAKMAWLYNRMQAETEPVMTADAAVLCAAVMTVCNGSRNKFAGIMNDANAYDRLKAYVGKCRASQDVAVLARACEFGAPFVVGLPGWHGRYYEGFEPEKLALERSDYQTYLENRKSPLAKNRQDYVSAVWSGLLHVPTTGGYTFRAYARDASRLWIDGKYLLSGYHQEQAKGVQLEQGWHRAKYHFQHRTSDAGCWLQWEGPGLGRQHITALHARTPVWRAELAKLPDAVKDLASTDSRRRSAAKGRLLWAGDAGTVFLRHALRFGPDAVAAKATELLQGYRDEETATLLVARLKTKPASPFAEPWLDTARRLAEYLPDADCAWIYETAGKTLTDADRPYVALLGAILERKCGGDRARFNRATGDDGAYDTLAGVIDDALASSDSKTVAWACRRGGTLSPLMKGVRGRYYDDTNFEKKVRESRDSYIRIAGNQFPHSNKDTVSARWNGMLWVEKPGDYSFGCKADDACRIWVDGKRLIDGWLYRAGHELWGKAKLDKGWHTIDVTFRQDTSNHSLSTWWQGPGLGRTELSSAHIWVHPTESEISAIRGEIEKLSSNDGNMVNNAKGNLRNAGDVAKVCLRGTLASASGKQLRETARLLVELQDATVASRLVARIRAGTDPNVAGPAVSVLQWMPDKVSGEQLAELLALLKDDSKFVRRELVDLFGVVFQKVCGSNVAKFDGLLKTSSALGRVREYLWEARQSTDKKVSDWAKAKSGQSPWKK